MLLCKKVSQRNCSFRKLKVAEFFESFKWDELTDFRMKVPFIPDTLELSKQLQVFTNHYETIIQVKLT
jgi:hypothetical protein